MSEFSNNSKDDKLDRLCKVEARIYNAYLEKIRPVVDEILDEKIPENCGTLNIMFKGKDISVSIVLMNCTHVPWTTKDLIFDNEYVWRYVVNTKFYHEPKIIRLESMKTFFPCETITLSEEFYKELDDLWNDKEYVELVNELTPEARM